MLESSYCKHFGRPAKEPEMMMRLLFLQYINILSDVKVIEEANCNLAFLWFLGLNPEDKLPDPSLLAKFRTHRMQDITLDEVLCEIVRQCAENGIIKSDALTMDTTHKKIEDYLQKFVLNPDFFHHFPFDRLLKSPFFSGFEPSHSLYRNEI